jgi:hypothetical protein
MRFFGNEAAYEQNGDGNVGQDDGDRGIWGAERRGGPGFRSHLDVATEESVVDGGEGDMRVYHPAELGGEVEEV